MAAKIPARPDANATRRRLSEKSDTIARLHFHVREAAMMLRRRSAIN
jgi:hypothetical protein